MANRNTNRLAGLPQDVDISDVSELGNEFTVELKSVDAKCPYCGNQSLISKGKCPSRTLYHTPRGKNPALIHIRFPRFYCRECGVSFTYRPDWVHPWLPITRRLFLDIIEDFHSTKSMRLIAADNGVSESIVRGIFDSITIEPRKDLPETLCIDEFKGDTGFYDSDKDRWRCRRYQCNILDGTTHDVMDILPSRDYPALRKYFMQYPLEERKKVRFLCCDMHGGFAKLRHSVFPNAILCIDRFHVVQLLNNAVSHVRIRYQKEMKARLALDENDEEAATHYDLLKNSAHLLTTKDETFEYWEPNVVEKKKQSLSEIFSAFPDLLEISDSLQNFHVLTAQENSALCAADLSEWILQAESSNVEELRDAAATIKKWKEFILNGLREHKNNSACEGVNRVIKDIKRNSAGFKNFDNFRKRILLACGSAILDKTYSISRKNISKGTPSNKKGEQHNEPR